MASITSLAASPTTVFPGGGQSTITPVIANPDQTATVTVSVDGSIGTAQVTLHETLTFTTDQTKQGVKGFVVASVDKGGSLAVGSDGMSFVFTAS